MYVKKTRKFSSDVQYELKTVLGINTQYTKSLILKNVCNQNRYDPT